MIFEVFSRFADMCGNECLYHHCYVEAESEEMVRKIYPESLFVGFSINPIEVQSLPDIVQKPLSERAYRYSRNR